MVSSVQPNPSALAVLKILRETNGELDRTQERVASGLRVATAADAPSTFLTAQALRGDLQSLETVNASLSRAQSIADVAIASGEAVSNLLIEMRESVIAASSATLTDAQRAAYDREFQELKSQIENVINNASFDDENIINGSRPNGLSFLADANATQFLNLPGEDFSLGGATIVFPATSSIATLADADAMIVQLQDSQDNVLAALTRLAGASNKMSAHSTFLDRLSDVLTRGVGDMVDADLGLESARLSALQVKQQLSSEAISIANATPRVILELFR
jgi:flagellin